VSDVMDYRKQ